MPVRGPAVVAFAEPFRAMILDHDPEYAAVLTDVLSFVGDGPDIWATTSPEAVRKRVTRQTYRLIMVTAESATERLIFDIRRFQPDAVVVVISDASMSARQVTEQFAAGADEVVRRPFHPSVLVARLNRLLEGRSPARARADPVSLAPV